MVLKLDYLMVMMVYQASLITAEFITAGFGIKLRFRFWVGKLLEVFMLQSSSCGCWLCVVGFGGIITVTYSLDIGAGLRSL